MWFGAPSTFNISGLDLDWHWQLVCVHVQCTSHYGMVILGLFYCGYLH